MIKKILLMFAILLNVSLLFADLTTNNIQYSSFDEIESTTTYNVYGTTGISGILGDAMSFDGSNSYINIGGTGDFDYTTSTPFSISAFVNSNDVNDFQTIVSKSLGVAGGTQYELRLSGGSFQILMHTGTTYITTTTSPLSDNTWYHVVTTYDGAGNLKIYLDGVEEGSISGVSFVTKNVGVEIGARHDSSYPNIQSTSIWNGEIDEVAIYPKSLTLSEISNLYQSGNPTQNVNEIDNSYEFYSSMDSLNDLSSNNNYLTGKNGVSLTTGKLNSSFDFDGVNDYLDLNTDFDFGDSFTISTWINGDSFSSRPKYIISENNGGSDGEMSLYISHTTSSPIFQWVNNLNTEYVITGDSLSTNQWYNIVAIYDDFANEIELYVNGVSKGTTSVSGSMKDTNRNWLIGKRFYSSFEDFFDGKIDELSIYNKALSPFEISQLYNSGNAYNPYSSSVTINVISSPIQGFNYTYDVEDIDFDLTTNEGATCRYTDLDTNTTIQFSNSDNTTSHTHNYVMGLPINETLEFNIQFECISDITGDSVTSETYTFYRQPEPLEFDIIVPQDGQIFNFDTQEIEFHMLTNYISECEYLINNGSYVDFTQTNSSIHKTNFTTIENITTYSTTFQCYAPYVDNTTNISLTFYLDEMTIIGENSYVELTSSLPKMSSDLGGFLNNIGSPLARWVLLFTIVTGIGLLIFGLFITLKTNSNKISKK